MENSDRYSLNTSQQTVVSFASSKSKNAQLNREALTVESFIPEELVPESQYLIEFFSQYYQWLQQENLLIDSDNENHQVKIKRSANSIYSRRRPDEYENYYDHEVQLLFDEFARNLPANTAIDFRTVLKHILSLYRQKGGTESIQSFFRILYNVSSSVYYPWDDVLIASSGEWDGERFISNKGFLSDRIHLQDSNYWQRFSYDIKVGVQEGEWRNIYEALIHPSGFKFFASFILVIFANSIAMKRHQESTILLDSETLGTVFRIISFGAMTNKPLYLQTLFEIMYVFRASFSAWRNTFTELAFYNTEPMEYFDSKTLDELVINNNKYAINTMVTIKDISET
jgi:hypothetical protein